MERRAGERDRLPALMRHGVHDGAARCGAPERCYRNARHRKTMRERLEHAVSDLRAAAAAVSAMLRSSSVVSPKLTPPGVRL